MHIFKVLVTAGPAHPECPAGVKKAGVCVVDSRDTDEALEKAWTRVAELGWASATFMDTVLLPPDPDTSDAASQVIKTASRRLGLAQALDTLRYSVAASIAVFMLFADTVLAGLGHGWVSGAYGCFALAPVACFAWGNALGRRPSLRGAIATLVLGLVVCVGVVIATEYEGFQYFFGYWRSSGIGGVLVGGFAYLNWLIMSVVGIVRARRVLRSVA